MEKAAKIIEKRIEGKTRHPNGSRFGVLTASISRQRILQIIESSGLKAEMVGRNYVILQFDFETWNSSRREAGRPPKVKGEDKKV